MAASRLSDAQKQELVERWRGGASSTALADGFGCSPNTVTRVVKAALDPALYEQLKKERGSRPMLAGDPDPDPVEADTDPIDPDPIDPDTVEDGDDDADASVLAIDDADDFGDDGDEDIDAFSDEGSDEGSDDAGADLFVPVAFELGLAAEDRPPASCQPLDGAALPASLYMLVDKTVELQPRPLHDFPELGRLPDDEQGRQALVVFANPRQAKRHCGRTQRVIKLPDSQVIHRTASYLLTQGITRLVLEGAVYSLPGS